MISPEQLSVILNDQLRVFQRKSLGVPRIVEVGRHEATRRVTAILGVRRCGKSTLLRQIAARHSNYRHLNFDDERLQAFDLNDTQPLMREWHRAGPFKVIFMDEVQNLAGWERFVRRLHDEDFKIYLTGSNAKLLASDLATHLTGRCATLPLSPFSFAEFLRYRNLPSQARTTRDEAALLKAFDEYLTAGGFPEYLRDGDPDVHKVIYEGILYRDLISRFRIKQTQVFRDLAHFLFSNFTQKISYQNLSKTLAGTNVCSVHAYVGYMRDAQLVHELFQYNPSLHRQHRNEKKVYVVDNGLRHHVAFSTSADRGHYLENLVHAELRRRHEELYFHKGSGECDFLVRERGRINQAIQVCWEVTPSNRQREVDGLKEALARHQLKRGLLITHNQDAAQTGIRDRNIAVTSVWRWLTATK